MDLTFPEFLTCKQCGRMCRIGAREVYEMPEGVAGVAWATCRKCRRTFIHFVGGKKAVAVLAKKWLGLH